MISFNTAFGLPNRFLAGILLPLLIALNAGKNNQLRRSQVDIGLKDMDSTVFSGTAKDSDRLEYQQVQCRILPGNQ
jgi:hypothetical protein